MNIIIAEAATASPLQWWQIATGILAVPTAVLGLLYTFVQIQKARVEIGKTRAETAKLTGELSSQRRELDEMVEFLYDNFINEAELHHLEGLESPTLYPFNRTAFADAELRRLRALRLITISPNNVGKLPGHMPDLHEHVEIIQHGRDYLVKRRKRASKQVSNPS